MWHWQTWNDLPYLTCELLKDWKHGFFTHHFSPRLPEDLVEVLHPSAMTYRVKQVHGNQVLAPSEIEFALEHHTPESGLCSADGLISEQPEQAVWVATADCTPVLIADTHTGQVSAVHAGWRGTAQRIVPQAIDRLLQSGSQLENLRIAMGPAIAGQVYQVDINVAGEVGLSIIEGSNFEEIVSFLKSHPSSPILPDTEEGKVKLDVRMINLLQLQQLGIAESAISIAPYCTYQTPDYFFSYRRNPQKLVQWSGIVSR